MNESLIGVLIITVLFLYHVLTLPVEINQQTKRTKWIAFLGYLILSIVMLINTYVVSFFKFHYSMLVIALLPAVIYSLFFERRPKNTTHVNVSPQVQERMATKDADGKHKSDNEASSVKRKAIVTVVFITTMLVIVFAINYIASYYDKQGMKVPRWVNYSTLIAIMLVAGAAFDEFNKTFSSKKNNNGL